MASRSNNFGSVCPWSNYYVAVGRGCSAENQELSINEQHLDENKKVSEEYLNSLSVKRTQ